jgi:hypothetical protein
MGQMRQSQIHMKGMYENAMLYDRHSWERGTHAELTATLAVGGLDVAPGPLMRKQDADDLAARMTALGSLFKVDKPTLRKIAEGKVAPQFTEDGFDVIGFEEV